MKSSMTLCAGLIVGLAGCALAVAPDQTVRKGGAPVEREASAPDQKPWKVAGVRSGIRQERFVVVRDMKALEALLKEHNPAQPTDSAGIDFKKQTVVAFFAGSKPTGGYTVEVTGVDRKTDSATVKVRLWKPGPGAMVTQAFTSPFVIEAVDKLPAKVSHKVTVQERPAQ